MLLEANCLCRGDNWKNDGMFDSFDKFQLGFCHSVIGYFYD